jgi:hypothetical protein
MPRFRIPTAMQVLRVSLEPVGITYQAVRLKAAALGLTRLSERDTSVSSRRDSCCGTG